MPAPEGADVLEPTAVAPVYQQLRKVFEDGKNEPGATGFYYGEMEMRRHDRDMPRSERGLLTLYWAVSGYGLRASRALAWLLMAMTATTLVMMLWGDPPRRPQTSQYRGYFEDRRSRSPPTPRILCTLMGSYVSVCPPNASRSRSEQPSTP